MKAREWLAALGVPPSCISHNSSAQERQRRFSIRPQEGDEIWRVKVDGCWLTGSDEKRVDYLFWGQSASGQKTLFLVELKGQNFTKALQQIESTLGRLCRKAEGCGIHTGAHLSSPGHARHSEGGVRAYVVLSKGGGVAQSTTAIRRIQKRYGVLVYPRGQRLEVNGLDALPG